MKLFYPKRTSSNTNKPRWLLAQGRSRLTDKSMSSRVHFLPFNFLELVMNVCVFMSVKLMTILRGPFSISLIEPSFKTRVA